MAVLQINRGAAMTYESRIQSHQQAAQREEEAFRHAKCCESARRHLELAEMHKNEALKLGAVRSSLSMALGDQAPTTR
jgi:hypothetical protein